MLATCEQATSNDDYLYPHKIEIAIQSLEVKLQLERAQFSPVKCTVKTMFSPLITREDWRSL